MRLKAKWLSAYQDNDKEILQIAKEAING